MDFDGHDHFLVAQSAKKCGRKAEHLFGGDLQVEFENSEV